MCAIIISFTKSSKLYPDQELYMGYVCSCAFNAAILGPLHVIYLLIKLWQVSYCKKMAFATL